MLTRAICVCQRHAVRRYNIEPSAQEPVGGYVSLAHTRSSRLSTSLLCRHCVSVSMHIQRSTKEARDLIMSLFYETSHRAARFVTKVREVRARVGADKSVCVFSGDAFSPSLISTVSKGAQMVPVLNSLDIDVALCVHPVPSARTYITITTSFDHHHHHDCLSPTPPSPPHSDHARLARLSLGQTALEVDFQSMFN